MSKREREGDKGTVERIVVKVSARKTTKKKECKVKRGINLLRKANKITRKIMARGTERRLRGRGR